MKIKNWLIIWCVALAISSAGVFAQTKTPKTEVKFGFLKDFRRAGGGFEIKIDYAEMFEGVEAEREAKKDGEPSPGETSGIYIRNRNPKIHVEKLAANAVVFAVKNMEPFRLTILQFEQLRSGKMKNGHIFWGFPNQYGAHGGEPMPCSVTITNGAVTKIEQVYFP